MQGAAPAELEGKKANLVTGMQSQEWLKIKKKKKKGRFRSAHCFLYLLCSQEGEREKLISLFFIPFHCNTSTLGSSSPTAGNKPREKILNI